MKIEKISENQIKFILNKTDLIERNMKLAELSYGSEKTQELFREMMEQAMLECDFRTESNTPLIIEAIPVSQESLMIIVTKTSGNDDIENKFSFMPRMKDPVKQRQKIAEEPVAEPDGTTSHVFVFKSFDEIAEVAARIDGQFEGESSVYKKDKKYYLVLNSDVSSDCRKKESLELLLLEYAQKVNSSAMSRVYLEEHGEVIIAYDAIKNLAEYMA